jgi:hypothetical protein
MDFRGHIGYKDMKIRKHLSNWEMAGGIRSLISMDGTRA